MKEERKEGKEKQREGREERNKRKERPSIRGVYIKSNQVFETGR